MLHNTTARASLQSNANGFDLGFDLARKASRATPAHARTDPHTVTAGEGRP